MEQLYLCGTTLYIRLLKKNGLEARSHIKYKESCEIFKDNEKLGIIRNFHNFMWKYVSE